MNEHKKKKLSSEWKKSRDCYRDEGEKRGGGLVGWFGGFYQNEKITTGLILLKEGY